MNQILYHGSTTFGIIELEPRLRCTPGQISAPGKMIYAAIDPAYAAGHSFEWGADEGFDIYEINNVIELKVPKKLLERLEQQVCIYEIPSEKFRLLIDETMKKQIFAANENVRVVAAHHFSNVVNAVEYFGGRISEY